MATDTRAATHGVTRSETAPAGWAEYLGQHAHASIYHDPAWAALIRSCFGHGTFFLAAHADGVFRGVLPLVYLKSRVFGRALVSMPYFNYGGILANDAAVSSELIASAMELKREIGADYIELRQSEAVPGDWPVKCHKVNMLLPLPRDPEALWQSFKAKLRTRVRGPEKNGFTFHWGKQELLNQFYPIFAENMRDLGTPVYPKSFFGAILAAFPEQSHVAVVRRGDEPMAAGFLIGHRNKLEVPWSSSLRRFNRLSPNMMLYWRMMRQAILEGYEIFDFGRSSPDSGTYSFKQQWGAAPNPTYWYYPGQRDDDIPEHSPQSSRFYWATRVWRCLPLAIANRLGPPIVKDLP